MNLKYIFPLCCIAFFCIQSSLAQSTSIIVLNFQGDNGFEHQSKSNGLDMIVNLGKQNNWEVINSDEPSIFNAKELFAFDVIVFNNNCGNEGRIFTNDQQQALQQFIRNGGGFVGIHCAGAIWKEEGSFQQWYEKLIGTRMVDHPAVQQAKLTVENKNHISTRHLPNEWVIKDEWHRFSHNPREQVNVLISVDENSYVGEQKMNGDHPFTWCQHYDGGRSFFTSLGHTKEIYADENYINLVKGGIEWAANSLMDQKLPTTKGLILDLDADEGVHIENGDKVNSWSNKIRNNEIKDFVKRDKGRDVKGSGRPRLRLNNPQVNGHNSIVFHRQELLNENEDAFDHLTTGSGYTWFSVMAVYEQIPDLPGVNSFFGNLRNNNGTEGKYEGLWAGFTDDNKVWTGARNAVTFGRWDENNPQITAPNSLEKTKYYLVAGRMGSGTGVVKSEIFINESNAKANGVFPVNPKANASKMSIGQERDAIEHPGKESFDGEIARFLIFERPLTDMELEQTMEYLKFKYNLGNSTNY